MTGLIASFSFLSSIQWNPSEAMDSEIYNQPEKCFPSCEFHNDDDALLLILPEASNIGQS